MKTLLCPQGSDEWLMARCGVVTASEFHNIVTPAFKAREGQTRQSYMNEKLAEKLTGQPIQTDTTWSMDQGKMVEEIALPWFEFAHDAKVERVGFCTTDDGRIGASPDGLLGADGGIEVKRPNLDNHVGHLLAGKVPDQWMAQVHGCMFVTGRAWWKFLSYSVNRNVPHLLVHVARDEAIQSKLREALDSFLADFDAALAKINGMKGAK